MSSYAETLVKHQRRNLLHSVLVELTYSCNLDCTFCYNDIDLKGVPMAKEEYFQFFEDLRDMQVLNLGFSGGEPLTHPDFMALGAKARELGFVVRIKSNGHAIRGELARRIKEEIDPFYVEVTLHGAQPETHDRQTRVSGSFDQLIANVQDMKEVGLRVRFNAVLTRWNENEIEDMFDLADAEGVTLMVDPEVTPRDNGDKSPLALSASEEGIRELFRLQAARRRGTGTDEKPEVQRLTDDEMPAPEGKQCGAGSSGITVDPFGNVYPCVQWRKPLGNLHDASIKDIWEASKAIQEVRSLTTDAKKFYDSQSAAMPLVRFCVGCALLSTGNPLQLYPAIEKTSRIWHEVQNEKD
jgi:radical SAM protein with 4Fe4S-binding SPASM domain